jgi:hypothetical protein
MTDHTDAPTAVEIEVSEAMVEAVLAEYERDNPGQTAQAMTSEEFADRMMAKIIAGAKIVTGGRA